MFKIFFTAACLLLVVGCETINENKYYIQPPVDDSALPDGGAVALPNEIAPADDTASRPISMQCVFDQDGFGIRCFGSVAGGKGESVTGPGWYGTSEYGHGLSGYSKYYNGVFGRGGASGVRGDSIGDEPSVYATGSKIARIRLQNLGWTAWDIDTSHDETNSDLVIKYGKLEVFRITTQGDVTALGKIKEATPAIPSEVTVPCTVGTPCRCPEGKVQAGLLEGESENGSISTREIYCR